MSILEAHNVSIRYITGDFKEIGLKEYVLRKLKGNYHVKEFWADKNINFALEKGDMLGIIGSNGAGKSTLLKTISGIMEPTVGSIHREGSIAALLELGSGFDGDLTVRENTYLRGAMMGYTRKFMDNTYDQIIEFAELKDFQDRPFKQLSSGMKSRLAFSIASLVQPDILILDEVLSVGDGAFRQKSESKMREIIKRGATTILVSHSLSQIRKMCNKVLWLHKGRQAAFGDDVQGICDQYQAFLDGGEKMSSLEETCANMSEGRVERPAKAEASAEKKLQPGEKPATKRGQGLAKERWTALVPAVFLSFTFCIFGPLEIYMTNIASFPFQLHELVPACLAMFLCCMAVSSAVILLLRRNVIVISIMFGIAMAVYIQGNWMFVGYGEMDGSAIDWKSYGTWPAVNLVIWLALIFIPAVLAAFLGENANFKKCVNWISVGIVVVQCITLVTVAATTSFPQSREYYVASDEKMLQLSKNKNVVVMLFDAFQASYFQQTLEDVPDAQEIFEDFVFFDNAVGTSLYSEEGSATILTGNQLGADLPFEENIDDIYRNSEFFPALQENDYDTRYYIQTKMVSGQQKDVIKNILEMPAKNVPWYKLPGLMGRITAFRYAPHILKQNFWFSYDDIDSLQAERKLDVPEFKIMDAAFNQDVQNGKLTAEMAESVYRVYYLKGIHPPYSLDENGNDIKYEQENYVVDYPEDIHDNQMMYRQALGSIRIMANFIHALKDAGIYDVTDIIITADHGWENRYNPILLIKSQETEGAFSVCHAPVSYISDFGPTMMSIISGTSQKKTVFDYTDAEQRTRSFYIYSINPDRSYNSRDTWYTESLEVHAADFYFPRSDDEIQYQLGEEIVFTDDSDGRRYFQKGISGIETDFAWSLNNTGTMALNLGSVSGDLIGEFQFKGIYAPLQKLVIRCGDLVLFDAEIRSEEIPIHFLIPKDCIVDGKLVLDLEYPNAVSPKEHDGAEDSRKLAFRFYKIRFYAAEDQKEVLGYQLSSDIVFTEADDGRRYFSSGVSHIETDFAWSLGTSGQMLLYVGEDTGDLTGEFLFCRLFHAPQRFTVRCEDLVVFDKEMSSTEEPVRFTIPKDCVKDGWLTLELEYPDAVSPKSLGLSGDGRVLALGYQSIRFYPVDE